jgi:energy-coupling factor transport system ATP-binding protein
LRKIVLPDFSGIRDRKPLHGTSPRCPLIACDPIISVQDLTYSYGDILAVDSLNFSIYPGEFVTIVGENGSGKTTLVKHFNGLLTPTRGNVFIAGKNTRQFTITDLARDVGLVFQNPDHMFFADTVRQEVEFGLKNIGIPGGDIVIDKALDEAGLSHTKNLYPRWLSRGERQRLAIACIIAMKPPVIVLDEPTTGLDGNEARLVMEILKTLQQTGHTVIVITHNREIARYCADRIIVMEKGKIISDSSVGEC